MPLAKLNRRAWRAGHEDMAPAFPAPRKSTDTPNPGVGEGRGKVGIRDSHPRGCGGTWEGATLPSPPAHTSFHLSSDTKENLLLDSHGSFLAPIQILHNGVLEPLRFLNSVLLPYYHTKPPRNRALLFTGLPQPHQEGITECDPSHSEYAEDALTAVIQLPRMSTVPTCKHLHPPISRALDTGWQLPARAVTSQDCHTHTAPAETCFSRKPQPSHNQSKGFLKGTRTAVIFQAINLCTQANSAGRQLENIFLV